MKPEKVTFGQFVKGLAFMTVQLASLVYFLYALKHGGNILFAIGVTFGDSAAPNSVTTYLDALFSQSLANYRKQLFDNIGASNAFLTKLLKSEMYESADGGTDIREELMYELGKAEPYDGSDELQIVEMGGVTQAIYEWRQLAISVSYNMKQVKQNKQRLTNFVKTKITQMEMGFQESFANHLLHGNNATGATSTANIVLPYANVINSAKSIDPLPLMVSNNPSGSTLVGGIDPSSSTWWQNQHKEAVITSSSKAEAFMTEWLHFYNTVSLGTGGPPDILLCDQVTYELATMALWLKYRQTSSDSTFNFVNTRVPFGAGNTLLVMDDKVPDVYTGTNLATTYGTMYFLNTKFFKIRYEEDSDFKMLVDENGKTFAKPINQDARVGHAAWMGQVTQNNRRKQGVWDKIPRSLTAT